MRKLLPFLLLALVPGLSAALAPGAAAQTVKVYPRSGYGVRVSGALVQVSQDNATWTQVGTISSTPADGAYTTYTLSADIKTYKFVRLYVPAPGYLEAAEVQFYGADGVLLLGTPVGNQPYGNSAAYAAAVAFDGNPATFYNPTNEGTSVEPGYYLGLDRTAQLASAADTASPASVKSNVAGQSLTITSTAANYATATNFTSTFAPTAGYTGTATTIASQSRTDASHAVVNIAAGSVPGTLTLTDTANANITVAVPVTILTTGPDQLGTVTTTTIAVQGGAVTTPAGTVMHRWAYNTSAANTVAASTLITGQSSAALAWTPPGSITSAAPVFLVHEVSDGTTTLTQVIAAQLRTASISILILGDSLLARHGNTGSLGTEQYLVQSLQALAPNRTIVAYYAAQSGVSASYFAQGAQGYTNAVAAATSPPNFIVEMIGFNDANPMNPAANVKTAMQSTIAGMTGTSGLYPSAKFLVLQPPDFQVGPYFFNPASLPLLESYRTLVYPTVVDGVTAFLADPSAAWAAALRSHPEWYENDFVHCNDAGCAAAGSVFAGLLAPYMGLAPAPASAAALPAFRGQIRRGR